jgi:hypothetical protein
MHKNVEPDTPKAAGTSTMQTLRGQSTTLGGALSNFVSWLYWQHSRWIDSLFFAKRRARRLKVFNLASRAQADQAHLDCGQLSDCNHQLCQKLILSGESMYAELYAPNQDHRWGSFATVTLMALALKQYPDFAQYRRALAKRSGNFLREVNHAEKAGYLVERFEFANHTPDIVAIHRSLKVRSYGLVVDALVLRVGALGGAPQTLRKLAEPDCPRHWECLFGVFAAKPGHRQGEVQTDKELLGYARLHRINNSVIYRDFIGHGSYVSQGIMKFLHVQLVRWVLEPDNPLTQGVEYFNYGVVERGGDGLFFWKKKGLFAPYVATVSQQALPEDFSARDYLRLNPDLVALKVNPVLHYQMHGKAEQRPYKVKVPRDFDAEVYLRLNPDVQCKVSEADLHYSQHGAKENRRYWLRQGERL